MASIRGLLAHKEKAAPAAAVGEWAPTPPPSTNSSTWILMAVAGLSVGAYFFFRKKEGSKEARTEDYEEMGPPREPVHYTVRKPSRRQLREAPPSSYEEMPAGDSFRTQMESPENKPKRRLASMLPIPIPIPGVKTSHPKLVEKNPTPRPESGDTIPRQQYSHPNAPLYPAAQPYSFRWQPPRDVPSEPMTERSLPPMTVISGPPSFLEGSIPPTRRR